MESGWNHTVHFHARLLRAAPRPCARALDVGCGEGSFARQLASHAERVDAIDRDEDVLVRARAASAGIANLRFVHGSFLEEPLLPGYDFVAALATLHHLPFASALGRMAALLRPGGVLCVLGLHRSRTPGDHLLSAISLPLSRLYRARYGTSAMNAPIREPEMSLRQIRDEALAVLPGCDVTRHLFWRHSIVWRKPSAEDREGQRRP